MKKLGASITSILASTIILTIIFQILLNVMGHDMILPLNISMAILGGSIGTIGIFIIHLPSDKLFVILKRKFNNRVSINNQSL